MTDRDHEIRQRAFHLWEHAGRPHHRSDEFWSQAEREIVIEEESQRSNNHPVGNKARAKSEAKTKLGRERMAADGQANDKKALESSSVPAEPGKQKKVTKPAVKPKRKRKK